MRKRERALPSALVALEVEFTAKAGVVVGESGGVVESRSPILGEKGKRLRQKPIVTTTIITTMRTKENSYRLR